MVIIIEKHRPSDCLGPPLPIYTCIYTGDLRASVNRSEPPNDDDYDDDENDESMSVLSKTRREFEIAHLQLFHVSK